MNKQFVGSIRIPITYNPQGLRCCVTCGLGRVEEEYGTTKTVSGRRRSCRHCDKTARIERLRTEELTEAAATSARWEEQGRLAQIMDPAPRVSGLGPWAPPPDSRPGWNSDERQCLRCKRMRPLAAFAAARLGTSVRLEVCYDCRQVQIPPTPAPLPPVSSTRGCTRCKHKLPLAMFLGTNRRGLQTLFATCTTCRGDFQAYMAARHATVAVGGTSDGR